METAAERHVKGGALIDLVKFLKNYEKTRALPALSAPTRGLFTTRLMASRWYPLGCLHELLATLDPLVLRNDETRTLEMGAAGGSTLRGVFKAYVVEGDALSSVLAMRHSWRSQCDFGVLSVSAVDDKTVLFQIDDYPDMPMVHGLMTAGWGLGAARAAGAHGARCVVLDRPWDGARCFRYRFDL